ncbi:MAG: hypothetical protein ACOH5I_18430 [Oligoflexus sp.]
MNRFTDDSGVFMQKFLMIVNILLFCASCGFGDDQTLEVLMFGVYEAPAEASGERTPTFHSYTITGLTGVDVETGETIDFAEELEDESFRIIDRPQKIFSIPITDYAGQVIQSLTVHFVSRIEGGESDAEVISLDLGLTSITMQEPLEFEEGRDFTLNFRVKWRDTLTTDGMLAPELELVKKN